MNPIETIRKQFKPDPIRILLIGESPPASGKFFYVKSPMTTFTSRAFERVYGKQFKDNQDFLAFFKDKGCYLDDLSHEPVNHLSAKDREQRLQENIKPLSFRIRLANPPVICTVLKKIETYVYEAVRLSGCTPEFYVLPFPGSGWQQLIRNQHSGTL